MRLPDARRYGVAAVPTPRWLLDPGPDQDVVLSTRCRIARNLADIPFPWRATDHEREAVAARTRRHADGPSAASLRYTAVAACRLSSEQAAGLVDWRYASPGWASGGSHRYLLVARDAVVSAMVNEEDHLRFQAILPGLQVESALEHAEQAASLAESDMGFARRTNLGYLTASPANAGTGTRVSALLHLPALAEAEELDGLLSAAEHLGCAVRGLYGEGTGGIGELFQVSCMRTVGLSAEQAADRTRGAAHYLADAERRARDHRFGTVAGRRDLAAATREALEALFAEDGAPRRLVPLVSVLRLAIAQGVVRGSLEATAEWIALAGGCDAASSRPDGSAERYEAVRRSAALRHGIRTAYGGGATEL